MKKNKTSPIAQYSDSLPVTIVYITIDEFLVEWLLLMVFDITVNDPLTGKGSGV